MKPNQALHATPSATRPVGAREHQLSVAVFAISIALFSSVHAEESAQRTVGLTYPDQAQTAFLKAVLKSMNLPCTVKPAPDVETVYGPQEI